MKAKGSSLHSLLHEGINGLWRDFSLKQPECEKLQWAMADLPLLHSPSSPGEWLQGQCSLELEQPLSRQLEGHLKEEGLKSNSANPITWGWLRTLC